MGRRPGSEAVWFTFLPPDAWECKRRLVTVSKEIRDIVSGGKALAVGTDFQVNHLHVESRFLQVAGIGKGGCARQLKRRVLSRHGVNV